MTEGWKRGAGVHGVATVFTPRRLWALFSGEQRRTYGNRSRPPQSVVWPTSDKSNRSDNDNTKAWMKLRALQAAISSVVVEQNKNIARDFHLEGCNVSYLPAGQNLLHVNSVHMVWLRSPKHAKNHLQTRPYRDTRERWRSTKCMLRGPPRERRRCIQGISSRGVFRVPIRITRTPFLRV